MIYHRSEANVKLFIENKPAANLFGELHALLEGKKNPCCCSAVVSDPIVSTGIKQPHFHRLCCWEREPGIGSPAPCRNSIPRSRSTSRPRISRLALCGKSGPYIPGVKQLLN